MRLMRSARQEKYRSIVEPAAALETRSARSLVATAAENGLNFWRRNSHKPFDFRCSCQASAEHLEQCAEFLLLRNRGLGSLAVTVLPVALARRGTTTACAAVQSTASLFRRWRPAGLPAPGSRSALTGCLKLHGLLVSLVRVHRLAGHFFGTPSHLDG